MKCERCFKETSVTTMSMFNTDTICMDCKRAEKEREDYSMAVQREYEEVLKGNMNYSGIGYR